MIEIKQGNTFLIEVQVMQDDVAVDITDWLIRSQVRHGAGLVDDLGFGLINASIGKFWLSCHAPRTALWPVGELPCDIKYSTGSQVVSSDTFTITVHKGITQ